MSVAGRIVGTILRPMLERQARGRSPDAFARSLKHSGTEVAGQIGRAPDTPHNREVANHIIGIERWGSHRLRVALGEPFMLDSYRPYRLPEGSDMEALRSAFSDTRERTVALALELGAAEPGMESKVRHNDAGKLSVGGWLAYLEGHAKREVKRLKF